MKALLKRILSCKTITRLLTAAGPARTVILMYHDLRADDDFENWLRVPVSEFSSQLECLRELGDIIGPDELSSPTAGNRLRFLITFDDGYRNNFELAAPVLRRHRAPALFFVSTGHVQDQSPFWPDIVVTPIQALGLDRLDLSRFQLGVFEFHPADSVKRWDDIEEVLKTLKELGNTNHPTVAAVLQHMQTEYASTLAEHLPRFRPLAINEIKGMSTDPLVHFGSHGHYHDILTYHESAAVDDSLLTSRRILSEITGQQILHLAYPNGDYNESVVARAREAGYTFAHTNNAGIVDTRTPVMALPRLGVGGVGPRSLPYFQLNQLLARGLLR